ncbi:BamA/TamA family outer membrane protein [Thermoflexibacter ruber]|nr:BamA/TamA family outer membrane protein [Thermoflexibacter ruber]
MKMPLHLPKSFLLFVCFIFGNSYFLLSQEKKTFWQKYNPEALANRRLSFVPVPVIQSSPETGLRGGITLDYFFNTDEGKESPDSLKTRDSFAWIQALYSTRRQLVIEPFWQIFTKDEQWFLRGRGGYLDFYERFWGIGNETLPRKEYADIFYARYYFQGRVLKKVHNRFFAGLNYNYSHIKDIELVGASPTLFGEAVGTVGSIVSGIGTTLSFDYRDNPFSPVKGWFLDISTTYYSRKLGSSFRYKEFQLDFRKYFRIGKKDFLGFQTLVHKTDGDVPLLELPRLGSPNIMRGYFTGRYRDEQYFASQIEYRKPFGKLLVGAVFASAGAVGTELHKIKASDLRYTYGTGLRVLVNKAKTLYARLDFAVSTEGDSGFYLRFADAF